MYRDTKTSISKQVEFDKLVTLPSIGEVSASYLGVLPVKEFLKLITDGNDNIVKSIFIDNVRDFQGDNPVNSDIAKTIKEGFFDQFVLRNNGITIVARDIKVTSNKYTISDYQIVNGCQTSHVVYAHREIVSDDMFLPVKLIQTDNDEIAQSVIRSTNKQTIVDDNELLALTQFQRNFEDYFSGMHGDSKLYYERRAKQYANVIGIEKGRIISIGLQLKAFSSMFLGATHQAGRYQGTLLKSVNGQVFQEKHRPEPYYLAAYSFYRFELALRRLAVEDRIYRVFKYYLLLGFRFRFEEIKYPGAGSKNIGKYCDVLGSHLLDMTSVRNAFEECIDILSESLSNVNLPLERESAKSRPLAQEVERLAKSRNSAENE